MLACLLASFLGLTSTAHIDFDQDCAEQSTSLLQIGLKMDRDKTPSVSQKLDEISKDYSSISKQASPMFNCSNDYLLVFTRMKTGSSSLDSSIEAFCGWDFKVPFLPTLQETYPSAIKVDQNDDVAQDFLSKVPEKATVWIFTMTRNPFSRAPSGYYQYPNRGYQLAMNPDVDIDGNIEDFREWLWDSNSLRLNHSFYDIEEHFFERFSNVTGVHVDPGAFNHDEHDLFISSMLGNISLNVVLLRLEDSDQWWEQALSKYMTGFILKNDNEDEGDMYRQFKTRFIYSDAERSEMLNSEVLHFYSKAEIDEMLSGQMVGFPR